MSSTSSSASAGAAAAAAAPPAALGGRLVRDHDDRVRARLVVRCVPPLQQDLAAYRVLHLLGADRRDEHPDAFDAHAVLLLLLGAPNLAALALHLRDRLLEPREHLGDEQVDDEVRADEDDDREDGERQPRVRHALHAPERPRPAVERRHDKEREERVQQRVEALEAAARRRVRVDARAGRARVRERRHARTTRARRSSRTRCTPPRRRRRRRRRPSRSTRHTSRSPSASSSAPSSAAAASPALAAQRPWSSPDQSVTHSSPNSPSEAREDREDRREPDHRARERVDDGAHRREAVERAQRAHEARHAQHGDVERHAAAGAHVENDGRETALARDDRVEPVERAAPPVRAAEARQLERELAEEDEGEHRVRVDQPERRRAAWSEPVEARAARSSRRCTRG